LKVTPVMPAFACALRQNARKPPSDHRLPSLFVRMIGERFAAASSAALSGAPAQKLNGVPVFDERNLARLSGVRALSQTALRPMKIVQEYR
jgi:hypothetical protein